MPGPVLYTALRPQATIAALAGHLTAAFAADLAAQDLPWERLTDTQHARVAVQIMRQRPLLWIWDDLSQVTRRDDLLAFLRSARDTQAKMLLAGRDEEQAWLGDLSAQVAFPAMPASDRNLLVRAATAANNIQLTGLGPASPVLKALGGNPAAILNQVRRALAAGCATSAELEAFVTRAGTAIGQDD